MPVAHYPVELKITLSGDVDEAVNSLGLEEGREREVWFLEDDTPGLREAIPLFDAGLILRLRSDSKRDQSTVKLRPARNSQLVDRWRESFSDDDQEYRIEGDWAGSRKSLAASCVADFPVGRFAGPVAGGGDLATAFTKRQLDFIADCLGLPLNLSALTPLGPIAAVQWKDQKLGDVQVNCERWTVDELDFFELSARAANEAAAREELARFEAAVRALDLSVADQQSPKTSTVLKHLMGRNGDQRGSAEAVV